MEVYILKSTACLAILFAFYKLFLEKESIHKLKRYYLLAALVFSFFVPALVFTEYIAVAPLTEKTYNVTQPILESDEVINVPPKLEADVVDIAPLLWSVYFFGLFFFGWRFLRNLFQIFRRIRKNPKHKLHRFTQVLLQEKITPHTFFSYIFLNKSKFESKQIPTEVLLHEETHAQQKHSLDVVLVELLQVIFWINPFIYLTKKAIKLNHEFLADQAVLEKNIDENIYKNTLLSYLSPDSEKKYQPLANAINYSSNRLTVFGKTFTFGSTVGQVKKRFTIMKTKTSKKSILLRSLILLPLLAMLVYGFSERKTETIVTYDAIQQSSSKDQQNLPIEDFNSNTVQQNKKGNKPSPSDYEKWKNKAQFAIWIDGKSVPNKTLDHYKVNDFAHYTKSFVYKNARSKRFPQPYQLSLFTHETYTKQQTFENETIEISINKNGEILISGFFDLVNLSDLRPIILQQLATKEVKRAILKVDRAAPEHIVSAVALMLNENDIPETQKIDVENSFKIIRKSENQVKYPLNPPPPPMDTIFTYQRLAHRILTVEKNRPANLAYLKDIYSKMSPEQKEKIESPKTISNSLNRNGATPKQIAEYNALAKKYNTMLVKNKSIQIQMKDVERLQYLYGLMSDKQKVKAEPFPDFPEPPPVPLAPKSPKVLKGRVSDIPPPPEPPKPKAPKVLKGRVSDIPLPPKPPTPKSPLDHIIEMAKKDAIFYYEGEEITSDKAIELLKQNKNLNIDSRTEKGKQPIIKLSKKPIKISPISKKENSGYTKINNEIYYYISNSNGTTYYNQWGAIVDENGSLLNDNSVETKVPKYETIASIKKINGNKNGFIKLNNKTIFYSKHNETINYYDKYGNLVNEEGDPLTKK